MDEFLKSNATFIRLYDEYKKYGKLYIGFDFDGTIYDYHQKGHTYEMTIQLLRDLKAIGCKLICWTAQKDLAFVQQYCKNNNIPCDAINLGGIPLEWESRKLFFSALLDDRAGLKQVYDELSLLVYLIKKEKNV